MKDSNRIFGRIMATELSTEEIKSIGGGTNGGNSISGTFSWCHCVANGYNSCQLVTDDHDGP